MKIIQSPLKKWGAIFTILVAICTISTFSVKGIVWAADQRYVTQDKLARGFKDQMIQRLEEKINHLELKILYKEASKADQALLKRLKLKRETLLQK